MISNKPYGFIHLQNLHRPRLNNIIDTCMEYPLILFDAGSGFGKSIAIQQYMESRSVKHASILINELDNIPEQFWIKYTKSFTEISEKLSCDLAKMGFPFSFSEIIDCLKLMRHYLAEEENFCLVIDCFHLLTDPSILNFIEQMVMAELNNYHLIINSFTKIPMNVDHLTATDLVAVLTTETLCFTKEEVADYFDLLKLNASQETIDWIYEFSEGWPFAVKLLAFSLAHSPGREYIEYKVLPTFFDLMDTFTFKTYSRDWQDLLIIFSHLGTTIPIPLVMSVTDFSYDSIISMAECNPFVRHDIAASALEIHNIYLRFLCTKQMYAPNRENNNIYRKIGEWYYQNNSPYEALQYFIKCRYHDGICHIIHKMKNQKFSTDMADFLMDSIRQLPPDILPKYPDLPLYEALLLFNNGRLDEAVILIHKFEKPLLQPSAGQENPELLGESYCIHGLINMFLRKTNYVDYFKKAAELLPQGSKILNSQYPFMEIHPGLFSYSLSKNDIETSLILLREGLPYFTRVTGGCGAGFAELSYGDYEFLKGNLNEAEKYFNAAADLAQKHFQADTVLISYFMLLRINIAKGYPKKALEFLDLIKNFKSQPGYTKRNYPLIDIAKAWVSLKVGTGSDMAPWLLSDDLAINGISRRSDGRNLTLYANWLLTIKHNPMEALVYINRIEHIFEYYGLYPSVVHTHLLRYSAYKALGRPSEDCYEMMEKIYDKIKDANLTMFVTEHGTISRTALIAYKKYKKHRIPDPWIDHVLTKSTTYNKYLNAFKQEYWKATNSAPLIQLTASEMALLDCMCSGLSRTEIAKENGISENTVKSQLRTIYYKLNAANQAEAVYLYTSLKHADSIK